jgi:NAD(P)-dependent dehydrogenase (short-subunit alcohol dehydrogenase family)
MNLELQNELAVVFGAASGIGRAISEAFAREGANVAMIDRDPQVLRSALSTVAGKTCPGVTRQVDVTDFAAVQSLRDFLVPSLGPPRHIVFAVGAGSGKVGFPFWEVPPADWQRVLEVNLIGAVNVAHVFGPLLAEQRQGTMLFLSSVAGQIGSQTDPPYSAAKAGLINFAQVAAKDLAPYGVRVNVISPGMVQTPLNRSVWQAWNDRQPPEAKRSYDDWAGEKVKKVAPLGRWQTPEDMATMAVFLASHFAQNITGQTINVDGGQVMHS